jgi:hypothetical protein
VDIVIDGEMGDRYAQSLYLTLANWSHRDDRAGSLGSFGGFANNLPVVSENGEAERWVLSIVFNCLVVA